jgi:hypothetical protein
MFDHDGEGAGGEAHHEGVPGSGTPDRPAGDRHGDGDRGGGDGGDDGGGDGGGETRAPAACTVEERRERAAALLEVVFVDPSEAEPVELSRALEAAAELGALVDGAVLGLLPAWEASLEWARNGSASAIADLVARTRAGRAGVASRRRCALDCAASPALAAAAASGEVSLDHLRLLCRLRSRKVTRELFDRDVAELLEQALGLPVDRFAVELEHWYHRALAELEANHPDPAPDAGTEESTLRLDRSFQGRGLLTGDLTAEDLAVLSETIDARIERWRKAGQLDDDDRPFAVLRAAALRELIAEGAVSTRRGQIKPLMIVTATLAALFERASIGEGERDRWRAEILGGGPIGQQALRSLIERANLQLVVTDDDGHPLHVGRARRLATAAIYAALVARAGGRCEHPSCDAPHHRCHAHHIVWWTQGGRTDLPNFALLCPHHHRLVHAKGFTIERRTDGALAWRRPDGVPIHAPPRRGAA